MIMENKLIIFSSEPGFKKQLEKRLSQLNTSKKTLLMIEPYGAVNALLKHALSCGHQVLVLTANSDLRVVPEELQQRVQLVIQVNTADEGLLRSLVGILKESCDIHAVIPGFEYFVPLASQLSHDLKVPGVSPAQVMNLRSKDLMRLRLQEVGLPVPKFYLVNSLTELSAAIEQLTFPAICKPVDAAGSVHVRKVTSSEEAERAARRILDGKDCLWGHELAQRLLLEEYVEGQEYSVEGVIQQGAIHYFSITQKFVADQIEFVEIGHIANVPLEPLMKERIETYLSQVIVALGADNCPFHAELRVNREGKPLLMEIAARLAGDRIGELINLAREVNYYDAVLATYLGEAVKIEAMSNAYAGIRFFYRPELESYTKVEGLVGLPHWPIEDFCLYYGSKEPIPDFPKPLRRLGHVIMKSHNYPALVSTLESIDNSLAFLN
jgi:biotin carboxylase